MTDQELRRLSYYIALMSTKSWQETYWEMFWKLETSKGALEKAFLAQLRNIDLQEFGKALAKKLRFIY